MSDDQKWRLARRVGEGSKLVKNVQKIAKTVKKFGINRFGINRFGAEAGFLMKPVSGLRFPVSVSVSGFDA